VARVADDVIAVEWKPYQIDPGTAVGGEKFEAYNRRRWGSSGWTVRLKQEGRKDDAPFANWKWWPNTLKAHQWIQYGVETHQLETDGLNKILFRALYEEGANLSLTDTLVELGQTNFPDCDADNLRDYLENDRGAAAVQQEIQRGRRRYRISGVPFFVVGTEDETSTPYAFSGAQPPSTFLEVFRKLSAEEE
jgi:predicted DsbA family dithiol-disulfide isomerase